MHTISWSPALGGSNSVLIYLSAHSGATWKYTIAAFVPDTGSYAWKVAGELTGKARVSVQRVSGEFGISAADFTISAPTGPSSITVTSPKGAPAQIHNHQTPLSRRNVSIAFRRLGPPAPGWTATKRLGGRVSIAFRRLGPPALAECSHELAAKVESPLPFGVLAPRHIMKTDRTQRSPWPGLHCLSASWPPGTAE